MANMISPHLSWGSSANQERKNRRSALRFLAEEVSPNTYVNLMDQYRPCYRADEVPELGRPITSAEFDEALDIARRYGITRLDRRAPDGRFARM